MKICFVVGDSVGGIRKHVHDLISYFLQQRIPVVYVHSKVMDKRGIDDIVGFLANGLENHELEISKGPSNSDLINIWRIYNICKDNDVDIIHGHGAKGGLYARIVGAILCRKVIYTPHGGVVHERFNFPSKYIYTNVERLLKYFTTKFVFESNYTYSGYINLIGELNDDRFLINYNGIDFDLVTGNAKSATLLGGCLNLLVVGMLRTIKGQHIAIEAVSILVSNGLNVSLNLVGDGPELKSLISLAKQYRISDRVIFHGDQLDVSTFIDDSDFVIVPSIFESFGYVALEAIAAKKPVISSNVGGLCEIIEDGHTGLMFEAHNALHLARLINQLLENPELQVKLAENAFLVCSDKFSNKLMCQKLHNIYFQCLN